jgi:hypothetical protein
LDDAKDGLRLAKSMAKDKNNVIPKIEQEIPFIESYCSTKTVEREKQEGPAPTGDQYYKSQQASGVQRMTQSQPSNVQSNTPSKISDSERRPRFMDELDRLNTDPKFSKQDIIDYVKSKVVVKTT